MSNKIFRNILAVLLAAALLLTACSAKQPTAGDAPSEAAAGGEVVTEPTTVEAPEEEVIAFEVTDAAGSILSLIPIYNADAVTVIAGYVESARDAAGNPLTAEQCKEIGSIVGVNAEGGAFRMDTDTSGAPLVIEAYANDSGQLIAMKDVKDLNQNAVTEEFLKLNFVTDAGGIRRYMVEYTAVAIQKKSDGQATITIEGEKTKAAAVNAENTAVAEKFSTEKKKNEVQNNVNQQNAAAQETPQTPAPAPEAPAADNAGKAQEPAKEDKKQEGGDNQEKPTEPETTTQAPKLGIVLLANRTAKSEAPGVKIATGAVTITQPGDYEITSDTDVWHGQIIVKLPNTESADLSFRNVHIQNDTTNIIQIIDTSIDENRGFLEAESGLDEYASDYVEALSEYDQAPNVDLSFPEGTSSSFTTTVNSHTGVLYNESKLTLRGHGAAEFSSVRNPNNCICTTKSIRMKNVSLTLNTPQNENTSVLDKTTGSAKGIFSYSRITVESGKLTVKSNGDAIRCQKLEIVDGSVNLRSSACDGIDADDQIIIKGGTVKACALQKHSFKVRRINNTEKGYVKGRVRKEKGDTFEINGGTVIGESKRVTTVQPTSSQASLSCRIVKPSAGTQAALLETKTPDYIKIDGVKSSENKCTKLLYSASSLKKNHLYTAFAGKQSTKMTAEDWNNTVGTIRVISEQ